MAKAALGDLRCSAGTLVAGLDLCQELGVVLHPRGAPGMRARSQRSPSIDVANGGHRVARWLQHDAADATQPNIVKEGLEVLGITDVAGWAVVEFPNPDLGPLQ